MLPSWLFAPTTLIILAGLALGVVRPLLVKWGNVPNMGICVACFMRDIAGVIGLHRAGTVQYIHRESIGFILGSCAAAYALGELRARVVPLPWFIFSWAKLPSYPPRYQGS